MDYMSEGSKTDGDSMSDAAVSRTRVKLGALEVIPKLKH
jgi:hypothetical protein